MEILNDTPFPVAPLAGRVGFPGHSLTVVVKGTFDLRPGRTATGVAEQVFPGGDEPYPDDEDGVGGCRYENDFAYFKPRADLLLVGRCHAPGGEPVQRCRVSWRVGETTRALRIVGDRWWKTGLLTPGATEPEPFVSMELRYENSFGGQAWSENPVGKGYAKVADVQEQRGQPLPNIEDLDAPVLSPDTRVAPAGFGPLGRMWAHRRSRLGTYGDHWLEQRWPWFPEDFDWAYFNAAPPSSQLDGYLRGDEPLLFENLHPQHPRYEARLPGRRVRCFLEDTAPEVDGSAPFRELPMNLDTLWVDMDAERLVLVWRGVAEVCSQDMEEVRGLFVVSEAVEDAPRSVDEYQALLRARREQGDAEEIVVLDVPEWEESEEDRKVWAAAEASLRTQLEEQGIDPDNPPEQTPEQVEEEQRILREMGMEDESAEPAPTRERVVEGFVRGESFAGQDLSGLDLSGLELPGVVFAGAVLTGVRLSGSTLTGADLTKATLAGADLEAAVLRGADLTDADLTGARASGIDLTEAVLVDTVFEGADLAGAVFDRCCGRGAVFTGANVANACAIGSEFASGDFSDATVTEADFTGALLEGACFEGASGRGANFTEADLTGLRAAEGAVFATARFGGAQGKESLWERADLRDVDLTLAVFPGADFTAADLSGANLYGADLRGANLTKTALPRACLAETNLFESVLERADLTEADCRRCNLYGAELFEALVEGVRWEGANLKMTKLAQRAG